MSHAATMAASVVHCHGQWKAGQVPVLQGIPGPPPPKQIKWVRMAGTFSFPVFA